MSEQRPTTNVLLKHKERQSYTEFADVLETIAQKIRTEKKFTMVQDGKPVEVNVADVLKVEFEYETKGDKHSFEIEFDWYEGQTGPSKMEIL